jgi:hypothetical protein
MKFKSKYTVFLGIVQLVHNTKIVLRTRHANTKVLLALSTILIRI